MESCVSRAGIVEGRVGREIRGEGEGGRGWLREGAGGPINTININGRVQQGREERKASISLAWSLINK